MTTSLPGRAVLVRARLGDERAFEAVVDACGGLVLALAWRMVRNRHEAEDLAQEVFLRLFRVFDRYDPDRPFLPWLRRVAKNLLINLTTGKARMARRRTASLDVMKEAAGELPVDHKTPVAEEAARAGERADMLRNTMERIRPDYRIILALRYFEGRTYEEMASDLEIPLGTVKNRLFRAREELAGMLEEKIG